MKVIAYISSSKISTVTELVELGAGCQRRNQNRGITGVLYFGAEKFLQVFEGDDDVVDDLFMSIKKDSRHQDLQILIETTVETRQFPGWGMPLFHLNDIEKLNSVTGNELDLLFSQSLSKYDISIPGFRSFAKQLATRAEALLLV